MYFGQITTFLPQSHPASAPAHYQSATRYSSPTRPNYEINSGTKYEDIRLCRVQS